MLRFAIRNLLSRPVRSLLSLLGLTVAILGMVGLFSVAEGIEKSINSTFGRIPGLVAMQPGAPIPLFSSLPRAWGDEMAEVGGVSVVTPEIWQRANIINEKMIVSPPRFLFGVDIPSRLRLKFDPYQEDLTKGRYLAPDDEGTRNAVISQKIAEEFSVEVGDPLIVNGYELTIVGIYDCKSLLLDIAIVLDATTVRAMTRMSGDTVSAFYIEPLDDADPDQLVDDLREKFKGRELPAWSPGGTASGILQRLGSMFLGDGQQTGGNPMAIPAPDAAEDAPPMEIAKASEWAEKFEKLSDDLDIFLTIMTAIGVTIAVLSIINTMLMSVTERMIEFGILKANGWSDRDVLKLITLESGVLGVSGGVLGSALGWVGCLLVNQQWSDRIELYASPRLLLFSVCFSTVLGVLGGLYPAVWATRMSPMEAIRRG